MTNADLRNYSYASLLAGGLIVLVVSLADALMMGFWGGSMPSGMMGWMNDSATGWFATMAWWMGGIGVVTGGIVLYAAYRVRSDADPTTAGTLGIVGGALSLLAMGGWIVGAALSILGGALAIASKSGASPSVAR